MHCTLFSSPEPKVQVSYSDQNLSIVRHRCCKLFRLYLLLQTQYANFNQTWHKASLGSNRANEEQHPFLRGDDNEYRKHINKVWNLLKNHMANFNQTWHKASFGDRDSIFLIGRPCPFPRGDNYEIGKIQINEIWKTSSPEPLGQFHQNLAQTIFGWLGFSFIQIKGPTLFQGEIITK